MPLTSQHPAPTLVRESAHARPQMETEGLDLTALLYQHEDRGLDTYSIRFKILMSFNSVFFFRHI